MGGKDYWELPKEIRVIVVPFYRLGCLMEVLEGRFLTWIVDDLMERIIRLVMPLVVCVTKVNPDEGDDLYYVYLIDTLGWKVVGHRVVVNLTPMCSVGGKVWWVVYPSIFSHRLDYISDAKHAYFNNQLLVGRTMKPRGYNVIPYPNDEYYTDKPTVQRSLYFEEFISGFMRGQGNASPSTYEDWVMDYLAKVELLYALQVSNGDYLSFDQHPYTLGYVSVIKEVEMKLIADLKELIKNYPYGV